MKKQNKANNQGLNEVTLLISAFGVFAMMLCKDNYRAALTTLGNYDMMYQIKFCVLSAIVVIVLTFPVYVLLTVTTALYKRISGK